MSVLSQFSGSDPNRLKLKNGSTLDDIAGFSSNVNIRDFTAQNDHLMISMTDGKVYIGKRFNELLTCMPNNSNVLDTTSYDINIGGDPFPALTNRYTTGISAYSGATTDRMRLSTIGVPYKSLYLPYTTSVTVNGSSNNPTGGGRPNSIKRFMYSGDDLFYIAWHQTPDQLYIYNLSSGTPVAATYTYSGTQNLTGTSLGPRSGVEGCTYPELDPATGDIIMFMRINSQGYKLVYDHSANTWQFFDTVYDFSGLNGEPNSLAISGSNMIITAEATSRTSYLYSTNGGNNWTLLNTGTSNNWFFRQVGVANGTFYTVNTEGGSSQYDGALMKSTDLTSWTWVDLPEVPTVNLIRNNGNGTACYVSNGFSSSSMGRTSHLMAKIT